MGQKPWRVVHVLEGCSSVGGGNSVKLHPFCLKILSFFYIFKVVKKKRLRLFVENNAGDENQGGMKEEEKEKAVFNL